MTPTDPTPLLRVADAARPEFTSERLTVDPETATDLVCDAVAGVTATETTQGTKFRTQDGMLIAVVTETDDGSELQYRTAPASEPATLKARRLWRAMQPYSV